MTSADFDPQNITFPVINNTFLIFENCVFYVQTADFNNNI